MNCLEVYRRKLVRMLNTEFKKILISPEEYPVHDFRVGIKRITAFYLFLEFVNPGIRAKKILKPYRTLFKPIGGVRDLHIAGNLVDEIGAEAVITRAFKRAEKGYYKIFLDLVNKQQLKQIRVPTIASLGVSDYAILKNKKPYLNKLLSEICVLDKRLTQKTWHQKRILLKRYHHTLDAFQYCPGHAWDEEELKQIRILETLLGDWHDRAITANLVIGYSKRQPVKLLKTLKGQEQLLIGASRIYLRKYIANKKTQV